MTLTLATGADRDIYIDGDNLLATATDLAAALLLCESAILTLLGEEIFAMNVGMPYFEAAWAGTPNPIQFEAAFRATVLAIPDVVGISAFSIVQEGDRLRYTATIVTRYGSGVLNG